MLYDVIIVGAGPGGLACAARTAASGLSTLVLERKKVIGQKICAGGITWNGLMKKVPEAVWERRFSEQFVRTRFQTTRISSTTPIIATVNREKLGRQMADTAEQAGAVIHQGCQVTGIDSSTIYYTNKLNHKTYTARYSILVGADGSSSTVRRFLDIPTTSRGIGINYQIPGDHQKMVWQVDSTLFKSGYSWIFPHLDTISIGAYADTRVVTAKKLKKSLHFWSKQAGFSLEKQKVQAEYINFDFRGYHFGNIFLVGDAAGLASALTGEGIYPAIISGEAVGNKICNPLCDTGLIDKLIRNHTKHRRMVTLAGKNRAVSTMLSELFVLTLKTRLLDFRSMEMAQ